VRMERALWRDDDVDASSSSSSSSSSSCTAPMRMDLTSGSVTRQRFKTAFMAVVRTSDPSTSRRDDPNGETKTWTAA